jgi:hypothetical protein
MASAEALKAALESAKLALVGELDQLQAVEADQAGRKLEALVARDAGAAHIWGLELSRTRSAIKQVEAQRFAYQRLEWDAADWDFAQEQAAERLAAGACEHYGSDICLACYTGEPEEVQEDYPDDEEQAWARYLEERAERAYYGSGAAYEEAAF